MAIKSQVQAGQLKEAPVRPGSFLWGNLQEFRADPLGIFVRAAAEQGDIAQVRFGPNVIYQLAHPDAAQYVLQTNNKNFGRQTYGNRLIALVSGRNLFTSDGDYWLRQRRMMQPAFHRGKVAGFLATMTAATERLLARWQPAIEQGTALDMHREMMDITTEVVGQALFSVDLAADTSQLGRAFLELTQYINHRFNNPVAIPLAIPTRRNRQVNQAIQRTRRLMQAMLDERRAGGVRKNDLMDMLMDARYEDTGEGMTDEQLRLELGVMIAAGQETTSNALTWVFHVLSEHPAVWAKLAEEVDTVLAGRPPQMEDLPRLDYTRMVIEETMRLYPPAWALSTRNVYTDDEIMGYRVPKGAMVLILPYVMHRDPRFWEQPEQFDPLRFTEARNAERHRFAYLPFGAGPRKCIGFSFAMMEAQVILAMITQRVKLTTQQHYTVTPDPVFTLRVKGGLPMRVERR